MTGAVESFAGRVARSRRILLDEGEDGLLTVRRFLDGARGGLYMQPNAIDEAFTPYDEAEIVFR